MASFNPLQAQNFTLSGSGCSIGDTVLNLKSFKDILGNTIAMSDLGSVAFLTVEPGNGTQEEQVQFTGVTQNGDGTAQLTGISTVLFKSPYTATSGFRVTHPGSVTAVLSNTAGFYSQFGILADNSTITGQWTAPDPISLQGIATQNYVLNTATSGGTVKLNGVVLGGTAGETFSTGKVIYLNSSDGKWYLAKANDKTKIFNVQLGIAQSAGSANSSIVKGVLTLGSDTNQSSLVAGTVYYTDDTGTVSATPGTNLKAIGQGSQTNTTLYFDPNFTYLPPLANSSAQTGFILNTAASSVPVGFLQTDGAAVSRTTYAPLFTTIGTAFGTGDGSTTFNVPLSLSALAPSSNSFDAFSIGDGSAGVSSITWSHTIGSAAKLLVVGFSVNDNSKAAPTSVTFNGTAMTLIDSNVSQTSVEVFLYYLVNPTVGSHNVVITLTGNQNCFAVASSYNNIITSGTLDVHGTSVSGASSTITLSATPGVSPNLIVVYGQTLSSSTTVPTLTNGLVRYSAKNVIFSNIMGDILAPSTSTVITFGGSAACGGAYAVFKTNTGGGLPYSIIKI